MYLLCLLLLLSDPAQINSLLQGGLSALQSGRLQEARSQLERASELAPDNPYAWTSLSETYFRLKDSGRAFAAAKKAESVGSQNAIVCHALAMFYAEAGDIGTAARFEARFAESPNSDPEAAARAADLYLQADNAASAVRLARNSLVRQRSAAHEDLLGRALVAAGQTTEGSQHFQDALQLAPTDPKISFDFAQALLRKQDFGAAADALDPGLKAHPDDAQLVLAMGVARYGQRRFDDCITLLLRVIKLDPTIEQPYNFLGRMLDQAGSHLPEITEAFRTWTVRQPKNAKASFLLARAMLASGANEREAEALLRRSVAIDGRRWESHYELGVLALKNRNFQEALAELTRSIDLDPNQANSHYQLARVYDRLNQPEKAEAERTIHSRLTGVADPSGRP